MKRILVVDSGDEGGLAWTQHIQRSKQALVVTATRILPGHYDELLLVDYGDEESSRLVAKAVEYRAEHRGCRIAIVRVLKDEWSDTEVMARVKAEPTVDPHRSTISLESMGDVIRNADRVEVRFDPNAVHFEYAA